MKYKEHTYYYTDKRKTYSSQELGRFLRENNISPTEPVIKDPGADYKPGKFKHLDEAIKNSKDNKR